MIMEQLIENKFNYNQLQPEIAEFLKKYNGNVAYVRKCQEKINEKR